MKKQFVVTMDVPEGCPLDYVKEYIKDAVDCWGGQRHPDDYLFTANWNNNVKVTSRRKRN